MTVHHVTRETFHYKWNRAHKPALIVQPGDTVDFDINDVASWQITDAWESADLERLDPEKLYPLSGPVYVQGAEPGDALVIDVLEVKNGNFGWSAIIPGLGLLEEFGRPYLFKWHLDDKKHAHFPNGVRVPLRPFCGVLGVAPPEEGSFDVMPPGRHGGNMDVRHMTAGSRVELPVWVDGALFSTGDLHAAMGDGEVCVTAIECPGKARLRLSLKKGANLKWPRFYTKGEERSKRGYYVATGMASDLLDATKESVRNMIDYLAGERGMTREDAYVFCSVAADVRIHEVVDRPTWVVGTMIDLDCFP
jgi:acetamidase/formamidase